MLQDHGLISLEGIRSLRWAQSHIRSGSGASSLIDVDGYSSVEISGAIQHWEALAVEELLSCRCTHTCTHTHAHVHIPPLLCGLGTFSKACMLCPICISCMLKRESPCMQTYVFVSIFPLSRLPV